MRLRTTLPNLATGLVALGLAVIGCGSPPTANPDGGGTGACPAGLARFDGLCVLVPTLPAERTSCGDVTEYCDKTAATAPRLACLSGAPAMHPPTPAKVTLTGYVHPFSAGQSNTKVTVQVFKYDDLAGGKDITTVTPIAQQEFGFDPTRAADKTQYRACDKDPKIGCIPLDPDACKPRCADGLPGAPLDGNNQPMDNTKYCRTLGGVSQCADRLRYERRYAIANVPTNTQLVIRATGEGAVNSTAWNTLIQWNVFLPSDAPSCGGNAEAVECMDTADMNNPKYQLNVNVISQSDYLNIPVTAGLAGGISAGQGGLAGEVRDCDNVRVGNVHVGVSPSADRLTYFNGNPFNTIPDSSRAASGTDRLGLFAALNIAPGKVTVQAVGLVDGKATSLGRHAVWIYPGVVSVVNINAGKPIP